MAVPPNFVQALVQYADAKGAPGLQELNDRFDELFAQIKNGEGQQTVVNSSINGKALGFQTEMTVAEEFAAVGQALRELDVDNAGRVVCTYPDFSSLQR